MAPAPDRVPITVVTLAIAGLLVALGFGSLAARALRRRR